MKPPVPSLWKSATSRPPETSQTLAVFPETTARRRPSPLNRSRREPPSAPEPVPHMVPPAFSQVPGSRLPWTVSHTWGAPSAGHRARRRPPGPTAAAVRGRGVSVVNSTLPSSGRCTLTGPGPSQGLVTKALPSGAAQ